MKKQITVPNGLKDAFNACLTIGIDTWLKTGTPDQKDSALLLKDLLEETSSLQLRCRNIVSFWDKNPKVTECDPNGFPEAEEVVCIEGIFLLEYDYGFQLGNEDRIWTKEYDTLDEALESLYDEI